MNKTKLFVIDTNTLVSAIILSTNSAAAKAYYKIKAQGKIVVSDDVFEELSHVLIRPKFDRYLSLGNRFIAIQDIRDLVQFIPVSIVIDACRDPKDNKFLELAVEAGAECIITGDKDLLVLNPFRGIPILSAAEFLEKF